MIRFLAQIQLPRKLDAIRQRFQRQPSFEEILAAVVLIAAMIAVPYLIQYLIRRRQSPETERPRRLFRRLLRKLPLTSTQRRLLRRVARTLQLPQPAVLLLSPELYVGFTQRWQTMAGSSAAPHAQEFPAIARRLFPS